jgi:hypothetical protein
LGETGKISVKGVGKSEWPGSDDGQDNITCLERGAILRSCLDCRLKCETMNKGIVRRRIGFAGTPVNKTRPRVVREWRGDRAKNLSRPELLLKFVS